MVSVLRIRKNIMKKFSMFLAYATTAVSCLAANPTFTIDAHQPAGKVSPKLYGLMTEEINHSYDGGLYAELIQNRAFLDNTNSPVHWSVVNDNGAQATIALDTINPYNDKLTTSLRLTVTKATKDQSAGVANSGYWGIPVHPNTRYRASIIARSSLNFSGSVTLSIVSDDDRTVYASEKISGIGTAWKKFVVNLKTGAVAPTTGARFVIDRKSV